MYIRLVGGICPNLFGCPSYMPKPTRDKLHFKTTGKKACESHKKAAKTGIK